MPVQVLSSVRFIKAATSVPLVWPPGAGKAARRCSFPLIPSNVLPRRNQVGNRSPNSGAGNRHGFAGRGQFEGVGGHTATPDRPNGPLGQRSGLSGAPHDDGRCRRAVLHPAGW